MRTSMKTALGLVGAVDPLAALYPFINDYDWVLAQQFEQTTIGGVQYPFQDSGLTVPVTDVGDPVGGSVGMVETVSMLQTADANRPIWTGDSITLDGSAWLVGEPQPMICTIFAVVEAPDNTRRNTYFSSQSSESSFSVGVTIDPGVFGNDTIRILVADGERRELGNYTLPDGDVIPQDRRFVVAVSVSESLIVGFLDGKEFARRSTSLDLTGKVSSESFIIGKNPFGGPVTMIGKYYATFVADGVIPDGDIISISEALL
jgi:hypothetical protein